MILTHQRSPSAAGSLPAFPPYRHISLPLLPQAEKNLPPGGRSVCIRPTTTPWLVSPRATPTSMQKKPASRREVRDSSVFQKIITNHHYHDHQRSPSATTPWLVSPRATPPACRKNLPPGGSPGNPHLSLSSVFQKNSPPAIPITSQTPTPSYTFHAAPHNPETAHKNYRHQ